MFFVIKKDKKKQIRYVAIQSKQGKMLMEKYGIEEAYLGSLIFIDEGKVYLRSAGALRLCKYLKGFWPMLYLLVIIPPLIRNFYITPFQNTVINYLGNMKLVWCLPMN